MSVTLYPHPKNNNLKEDFESSEVNLQSSNTFKRAVVATGTWIFYKWENYNKAQPGAQECNIKILQPGNDADITSVNGSMYLMPDGVEGVLLFEHAFYGGVRKRYDQACPDVSTLFPSNEIGGVSSAIVLAPNQQWEIFTKVKYGGLSGTLQRGVWYPTPASMRFPNDTLKSLRKK